MTLCVEIEVRCCDIGEVVVAAEVDVGRIGSVCGRGDGEVERDSGNVGEERGEGCCDAAYIVERGQGADGQGHSGRVAEVAGVVLGAATDGDMGQG